MPMIAPIAHGETNSYLAWLENVERIRRERQRKVWSSEPPPPSRRPHLSLPGTRKQRMRAVFEADW